MQLTTVLLEEPEPLPYAFAQLKDVAISRAWVLAWTQHRLLACVQEEGEALNLAQLRDVLCRIDGPRSVIGADVIMRPTAECKAWYEGGNIDVFARAWATARAIQHGLE